MNEVSLGSSGTWIDGAVAHDFYDFRGTTGDLRPCPDCYIYPDAGLVRVPVGDDAAYAYPDTERPRAGQVDGSGTWRVYHSLGGGTVGALLDVDGLRPQGEGAGAMGGEGAKDAYLVDVGEDAAPDPGRAHSEQATSGDGR